MLREQFENRPRVSKKFGRNESQFVYNVNDPTSQDLII
jgi:hypothetical protein